ncbi:quinon protein alcohol dehydrogenase-like superfamily [Xylogone sp. PMI_703]|nr:quinon protein alcohol dehydrogenase-like superfamily [Xylogone sp. PMI_703]
MATVLPPPSKRQRTEAAERARTQHTVTEVPADAGSIRIQFYDEVTGKPMGDAPVLVPLAEATPKNLNLLLNTLLGNDASEYVPYRFTHLDSNLKNPRVSTAAHNNTENIFPEPMSVSTEEIQNFAATPMSIFKVQPATRCSATISGHGQPILTCQFSPNNSSRLVSGSGDNTARIIDCDTGTIMRTLTGHTSWVLAVSWSPSADTLATASMDTSVRLWSPEGKQLGILRGHTKWVSSLAWEPYHLQQEQQPRLASASKDATIRVWSTNQQKIDLVLSGHKGSVSCVRWGVNAIYSSSHDRTIKCWNPKDGTLIHTLSAHAARINHLALSTDFVLRTAYHDHTGKIPASAEEKVAKAKDLFLKAATIQGEVVERLVSASDDFTMYLWEPSKGTKPITRMLGHQKLVNHVTFSPDGLLLASAGFDNHVKLWNSQGVYINTLRGHVSSVYQCAFSADSRLLVTSSKDNTLKIWDMRTHKLLTDLPGHKDEVYAVDWSPDGKMVASGGKDKQIKLWRN